MNSLNKDITVAIISGPVGKTPKDVTYSFVFDEAYRLVRRGIDVHIVRSKFERGDEISYGIRFHGIERKIDARALHSLLKNIPVYPSISLLRKPTSLYWENLYATNVVKVVKRSNANLIHAHFAYPEGLVGLLAKSETKIPLIVTSHGYDLNVIRKYGYGLRLSLRYDLLIRRVMSETDNVVVPSKLLYLRALEVGAKKSQLSIIPNGVDIGIFRPDLSKNRFRKKYSFDENELIVLTVRGLEPQYEVDKVIKIAKILNSRNIKCKFIIVGDGKLRKHLVNLAGNLVNNKVYFIGRLPRTEIPYAICAADIVVDPCPIGQGINVLEAMACARPVLAVSTNGLWDYVIDNRTGFLIESDDIQGFVEKIMYLIQNEGERKRMGKMGRKIVEENFNIERRIDRIIQLYERLVL